MSIIKVDNVAVSFGGHNVIRDISYTVERGEILTILGANGCGKSTLLRAMLGIQKRSVRLSLHVRSLFCRSPLRRRET